MEQYIKELEKIGCIMIPGLYRELGDNVDGAQYFYFTSKKHKTIDFGALALVDDRYAAIIFSSDSIPLGWGLIEEVIESLQKDFKNG